MREFLKKMRFWGRDRIINKRKQRKVRDSKTITILSNDCTGGAIMKDLLIPALTPTINLLIYPADFIKFCSNIQFYSKQKLVFHEEENNYPIANLDDIEIHFTHDINKEQAERKWNRGIKRINFKQLFVIMNDRNRCTAEDIIAFDQLDMKNKVVFTHIPYPEVASAFYIKGFEKKESVGIMTSYEKFHLFRRVYDQFDFVKWFNKTEEC